MATPRFDGRPGPQFSIGQVDPRAAREPSEALLPALDVLEGRLLRGKASVESTQPGNPLMLYESASLRLPVQRTSSMVAELAPLDLWPRKLLRPGDVLIVDEPEAHLHPENQRNMATLLVRLVRGGIGVVCPTHSSLILHQVGNHLLATHADPVARRTMGFTDDDLLRSEEVGVYLFEMREDGAHIGPVPIEPGFGIAEDEFVRVAEAIGEQSYRLSAASMGSGSDPS